MFNLYEKEVRRYTLVTLLDISSVRKEKIEEFEKKNGGSLWLLNLQGATILGIDIVNYCHFVFSPVCHNLFILSDDLQSLSYALGFSREWMLLLWECCDHLYLRHFPSWLETCSLLGSYAISSWESQFSKFLTLSFQWIKTFMLSSLQKVYWRTGFVSPRQGITIY